MLQSKPLKPRKCNGCAMLFTPSRSFQTWCGPDCGTALALTKVVKAKQAKAAKERKAERAETRRRKEAIKTRGQWLAEAKEAIQQFRRLEELSKGNGCISCGRSQAEVIGTDGWKPGGAWDGGHFLGKGARPELALEPSNIWLQCKSCNAGSGKYARKGFTVNAQFKTNLIARIGLEAVEALESDHRPRHYSIDDLKEIKAKYAAMARELKKGTI